MKNWIYSLSVLTVLGCTVLTAGMFGFVGLHPTDRAASDAVKSMTAVKQSEFFLMQRQSEMEMEHEMQRCCIDDLRLAMVKLENRILELEKP